MTFKNLYNLYLAVFFFFLTSQAAAWSGSKPRTLPLFSDSTWSHHSETYKKQYISDEEEELLYKAAVEHIVKEMVVMAKENPTRLLYELKEGYEVNDLQDSFEDPMWLSLFFNSYDAIISSVDFKNGDLLEDIKEHGDSHIAWLTQVRNFLEKELFKEWSDKGLLDNQTTLSGYKTLLSSITYIINFIAKNKN